MPLRDSLRASILAPLSSSPLTLIRSFFSTACIKGAVHPPGENVRNKARRISPILFRVHLPFSNSSGTIAVEISHKPFTASRKELPELPGGVPIGIRPSESSRTQKKAVKIPCIYSENMTSRVAGLTCLSGKSGSRRRGSKPHLIYILLPSSGRRPGRHTGAFLPELRPSDRCL